MAMQRNIQEQKERAMTRDDSRAKLMVPIDTQRASPSKKELSEPEEEEHLDLETNQRP